MVAAPVPPTPAKMGNGFLCAKPPILPSTDLVPLLTNLPAASLLSLEAPLLQRSNPIGDSLSDELAGLGMSHTHLVQCRSQFIPLLCDLAQ